MFVKISEKLFYILFPILVFFIPVKNLSSEEVYLYFSDELLLVEFDKHILPRFKFKTQIVINAFDTIKNTDASIGVKEEGMRRADFARVIFHLWDEDTNLIASDSSFVDGSTIQYKSGIFTDCSVESASSAKYEISVFVSDTSDVRYITKEIHFNIYE